MSGQEPEDVALDSLAEIWPIRDSITSPDEAAMFEAKVRPVLTRLVRTRQRRELEVVERQAEKFVADHEGCECIADWIHARLALLREE